MTQGRKLRIIQIVCIVYLLCLFVVVRELPANSGLSAMTAFKWIILAAALFCAVDGFYMQKRLLRAPRNPKLASKSTPAKRWMAANVARLAFAASVGLWGIVLHSLGGPDSLANSLIGLGLILLVIWRPGAVPEHEPQGER